MPLTYSPGAAYGWRARIGLLQPGVTSDTNPFEFYLMAPPGVQLILTSLAVASLSQGSYLKATDNVEMLVERLLSRGVDAIMQSGVPPTVSHGWGFDQELRERVAKVTSVPYISDTWASIQGMRAQGMSRVVMLGLAFNEDLVATVRAYMQGAGIEVVAAAQAQTTRQDASGGELPLEVIYRSAKELFQRNAGRADGIWLTQASVPSVGVIEELERDLEVPVVSSAQALMWAALFLAGVHQPVSGFGQLFSLPYVER